jgi:hypothetical protein
MPMREGVLPARARLRKLPHERSFEMTIRSAFVRLFPILVGVGLSVQALAVATHPRSLEFAKSAQSDGGAAAEHDPALCHLCQAVGQARAQSPSTCALVLPEPPCFRSAIETDAAVSPIAPPRAGPSSRGPPAVPTSLR